MIFLYQARLVILSQPKTGTTALDNALRGRASMMMSNPPPLKHMPYHKFMKFVAPMIKSMAGLDRSDYQVVSVMREPMDWLGSWYRYRRRDSLRDGRTKKQRSNYTGNVEFEEFVREMFKPKGERPRFARVGEPFGVALSGDGTIGCDRIFPYEDLSGLYDLIERRTGKSLELEKINVSPPADLALSEEMREKLKARWAFAFDLHASLQHNGRLDARFKDASGFPNVDMDDGELT